MIEIDSICSKMIYDFWAIGKKKWVLTMSGSNKY